MVAVVVLVVVFFFDTPAFALCRALALGAFVDLVMFDDSSAVGTVRPEAAHPRVRMSVHAAVRPGAAWH